MWVIITEFETAAFDDRSAWYKFIDLFNSQSTFEQLVFQPNRDLQEHKMLTKDITAKLAEKDQQITFGPITEA